MPFRPLPLCVAASLVVGVHPAGAASVSPPARVGRIAAVTGPVSFHLADATEWQGATPNLPVTTGAGLWVAPAGEAVIGLGGGNRLVLGPGTTFDLDRLDDQALAATQAQGETYLHLRLVPPGDTYSIQTRRGVVTIASPGRYAIVSGDAGHPTAITVLDGAATLGGGATTTEIAAGQTLTIAGTGSSNVGPAVPDAFLRHVLAEERPPASRPTHAPPIVAQMTGAEALDEVGEWSETAEYGPVWYPPAANYVPYRQGRWAYVAPWGWTWVDDAPWGFAPTHYGRWSRIEGRWGWLPGRDWAPDRRPVYAPALVGFFGGAALGYGRGPAVGWAPLGPHDAYRPPYPIAARAMQTLNQPTGATIRIAAAPVAIDRSAITIVPTRVLTSSAPVAVALRPGPLPPTIGPSTVLHIRPPAGPTRATIGAEPATYIGRAPPLPGNVALPDLRSRGAPPPGATFATARPQPPAASVVARPFPLQSPHREPIAAPYRPTSPQQPHREGRPERP